VVSGTTEGGDTEILLDFALLLQIGWAAADN
jgi:hypothetical protein